MHFPHQASQQSEAETTLNDVQRPDEWKTWSETVLSPSISKCAYWESFPINRVLSSEKRETTKPDAKVATGDEKQKKTRQTSREKNGQDPSRAEEIIDFLCKVLEFLRANLNNQK